MADVSSDHSDHRQTNLPDTDMRSVSTSKSMNVNSYSNGYVHVFSRNVHHQLLTLGIYGNPSHLGSVISVRYFSVGPLDVCHVMKATSLLSRFTCLGKYIWGEKLSANFNGMGSSTWLD